MSSLEGLSWDGVRELGHKKYNCGHCGVQTGINSAYKTNDNGNHIYICGGCNQPTFFHNNGSQIPAPLLGNKVEDLPAEIEELYEELRRCTQVAAYTSCVLGCRKILMHIAVDKGATTNKSFMEYVQYLSDNHYTPPDGKDWVDLIRKKGNEANHEIVIMGEDEAFQMLSFVEMLLTFIFEFPAKVNPTTP